MEEVRPEVILDQTLGRVILVAYVRLVFDLINRYIYKGDVRGHTPDSEPFELRARPIIGKTAEELGCGGSERS